MPETNIIGATEQNRYYPYQSAFRTTRKSFWQVGQDSFTAPASQNPDMFQALTNIEPVTQGNLQRRRGYTLLSNQAPASPYAEAYSFRNETLNTRSLVFTASGNVLALNEDGSVFVANLFTPSISASYIPKMVLSRSYGYFSDGAASDSLKWNGIAASAPTKWGIDINSVAASVSGPNGPGTATDLGAGSGAGSVGPLYPTTAAGVDGNSAWSTPSNVEALDGVTSSVVLTSNNPIPSQQLQATNFGFLAVPATSTITGVVVTVYRVASGTAFLPSPAAVADLSVNLIVGGVVVGTNKANTGANWPSGTITPATYGGSTDMWGLTTGTLNPAAVSATNFGVSLVCQQTGSQFTTGHVDAITITVYYNSGATASWTNPNNILANDGNVATAVATTGVSSILEASNFGFSTSQPISGILVEIKCQTSAGNPNLNVVLFKNGNQYGSIKTNVISNTSLNFIPFGGSIDLWGGAFTNADVNASNFGVGFYVQTNTGSATVGVDYVRITIYSGLNAITLGSPSSGVITLLNGRVYTFAFQNSLTGHTSDLGPFTVSTGALSNNDQPLSNIPVSLDTQVDTKVLLATADGGDETTLYLVATIPNSQTTYTDNMPDSQLLTQPIYQATDINGNLHGIANNVPPPLGNFPTAHLGRLYMLKGPTLLFSKNLDDVTTPNGTITSKWEEAWPATNQMDISAQAETGTGLLDGGGSLWIATDTCIRQLNGDSPSNFSEPQITFNETGVLNQEVWQIVFAEGQPIGSMWLTPNGRVMFSDFNSYTDVGTPIQDVLNTINGSIAASVSRACFVSQGPSEYYMLYIPTGPSLVVNTVCVYNMRAKKWCVWQPTDAPSACAFNINAVGASQWIFATQAGPIYYWDSTVRQDQVATATPTSYAATATTSWLDFGDEGLTKAFNKIITTTGDANLTVGVNGGIRDTDLTVGGAIVLPPTTVQQEIFGDLFVPMVSQPGFYKWYQVTFTSPASTVQNVLDAFDFEIQPSMRM